MKHGGIAPNPDLEKLIKDNKLKKGDIARKLNMTSDEFSHWLNNDRIPLYYELKMCIVMAMKELVDERRERERLEKENE